MAEEEVRVLDLMSLFLLPSPPVISLPMTEPRFVPVAFLIPGLAIISEMPWKMNQTAAAASPVAVTTQQQIIDGDNRPEKNSEQNKAYVSWPSPLIEESRQTSWQVDAKLLSLTHSLSLSYSPLRRKSSVRLSSLSCSSWTYASPSLR